MSAVSDFLTQQGFWWGVPTGAIISGVITASITARSVRKSDERKAAQEDKSNREKREHEEKLERERREHADEVAALKRSQDEVDARDKREHEEKLSREKRAYDACTAYYMFATEALANTIDVNGTFNSIRDAFYNATGEDDPQAEAKIVFTEGQVTDLVKLGTLLNQVKFNSPTEIMSEATQLFYSVQAVVQTTTEPFAKIAATGTAGKQLDAFINAYRTYYGLDTYTEDTAKLDQATYLGKLQEQVQQFMAETVADMKAKGFERTPWG